MQERLERIDGVCVLGRLPCLRLSYFALQLLRQVNELASWVGGEVLVDPFCRPGGLRLFPVEFVSLLRQPLGRFGGMFTVRMLSKEGVSQIATLVSLGFLSCELPAIRRSASRRA